jgi:SH3 domain protein
MKRVLPFLLLMGVGIANAAEYGYVDEKIKIILRSEQGDRFQAVSALEAGARLEILEYGTEYIRVRDAKGKEGWLRAQHVTKSPPARDRLVHAEKKIAALESDKEQLRQRLAVLESERNTVQKERTQFEKESQRAQQELSALATSAAEPLKLSNENKTMRERIVLLETEGARLLADNQRLSSGGQRQWFLTGAGVLVGGILIGLIAPRFKRRKSSWSSDF